MDGSVVLLKCGNRYRLVCIFQVRIYFISRGCYKCSYYNRLKTSPVDRPEGLTRVAVYDCIVSRIGGERRYTRIRINDEQKLLKPLKAAQALLPFQNLGSRCFRRMLRKQAIIGCKRRTNLGFTLLSRKTEHHQVVRNINPRFGCRT